MYNIWGLQTLVNDVFARYEVIKAAINKLYILYSIKAEFLKLSSINHFKSGSKKPNVSERSNTPPDAVNGQLYRESLAYAPR